jgi:hypothetical protein
MSQPDYSTSRAVTISKPKTFIYKPQEDITPWEIAQILPAFSGSSGSWGWVSHFIEGLPESAKRHFVEQ